MSRLDEIDIKFLTGVGPKRAELLGEQLHIRTFYDLLYYFPFRYVDRSRIFQIRELESGMPFIQLKGRFVTMTTVGEGAKRRMQALFSDGTGTIDVVWFNRIKFVAENYRTGVEYVIFGRPSIFNGRFNLAHPEIETSVPGNEPHGLRGAYNMTDKLRNRGFTSKTF
uniref:OB-fold nucleic acid binding domain-containing protein n=1 Tax=Candidatus Limisoma sp. TaxID=3076476 RepID=UPI0040279516